MLCSEWPLYTCGVSMHLFVCHIAGSRNPFRVNFIVRKMYTSLRMAFISGWQRLSNYVFMSVILQQSIFHSAPFVGCVFLYGKSKWVNVHWTLCIHSYIKYMIIILLHVVDTLVVQFNIHHRQTLHAQMCMPFQFDCAAYHWIKYFIKL